MTLRKVVRRCAGLAGLLVASAASAGTVEIDPALRPGADRDLALKVREAVAASLGGCADCKMKVGVKNGHVELSGIATPEHRPQLEQLKGRIPGVRSLSLTGVAPLPSRVEGETKLLMGGKGAARKQTPSVPGGAAPSQVQGETKLLSGSQGSQRKAAPSMPGR
ncbi:MAG: hypothetical protein A3I14_18445 [Candidatus Rokubacteria bacterium RIFCSPLOWO2_02_FULL_73_56]|nr:MAG: hypothetical protein A3D33_10930 [Candidatus Rokubacteria bacterium RIFCSPHIGHO2_02_FULL_73_26]OGL13221.1 MAG: hypothetical protein A3I14_18445 [Candidatus Rokubacteria bacterium RIFCSPLOWO2_02_FULL_73_56]OGL28627.1 MAG: hypothetical protein A3G44_16840 [Candidatus Rokubacteria bacterium RIFCSPLOWO2_12_FULL_73_47]